MLPSGESNLRQVVIDILHDGKEATKPVQRRDRIGVVIRDIDKMVRHLVNVAHPVPESSRCLPHIRTSRSRTVSRPRARQPDRSRASVYRGCSGRARLDYLPDLR
jgi:hypothetical protein